MSGWKFHEWLSRQNLDHARLVIELRYAVVLLSGTGDNFSGREITVCGSRVEAIEWAEAEAKERGVPFVLED